ncbi:MAG: hypothetical protein WCY37_01280 [Candidatus Dojkabacteria bacterium]
MENNHLEQDSFQGEDINIEIKNSYYVEKLLDEHTRTFKELLLKDGTKAAVLYNDVLISQENKEILPPYEYFVFSKYGLTQFNSSYKGFLGWTITTNAVASLIELSKGEEVENLVVSEWKRWKRNRINKGLIPLKMVLRSVTVTGRHQEEGIEDFYEDVIIKLNL